MPGQRLLHVTTTDMSLDLLLGPQLRAFQDAGYEVHTASAAGPHAGALEAAGIVHHELRHATRAFAPLHDLAALGELVALFRKLAPDIVHTHNPKPGVYGRIAAWATRVPLVVNTQHGLYAQPTDRRRRRWPVYALERFAAAFSDVELVQNPEDVETLRRLRVPQRRLRLLGNGIDLTRFRPDPGVRSAVRKELGIGDDDVVVGAVGRLVREKGYPELFRAAQKLRDEGRTLRWIVAGPADESKADALTSDDLARAKTAGVKLLGYRDDPDRVYQALDIYVLASHREGWPRSAMEAAACGLPVVATDIRGCRQVVEHGRTGLLVPVRDHLALAQAIGVLTDDHGLRVEMGRTALAKARAEFDQASVIERTLAAYTTASRRRRHRGRR